MLYVDNLIEHEWPLWLSRVRFRINHYMLEDVLQNMEKIEELLELLRRWDNGERSIVLMNSFTYDGNVYE